MADQIVTLVSDVGNVGRKIDCAELTVGANVVERQRIVLADPVTAAAQMNVTQFHATDNVALGTFYGIAAGGIGQVLNVSGNLDRCRGMQGDQLPGTGIPLDLSMTCQVGVPVLATNTVTAGSAKTINIASTANIIAGSVVQIDSGANREWAIVTSLVANTSITVATLALGHTANLYTVVPIIFNMPRDASGEADLSGGVGASMAVDYGFDGLTYQRQRNALGVNIYTDTNNANNAASTVPITLTLTGTPPNVPFGTPCLVDALTANAELCQIISVNTGAKTITLASTVNAHNGTTTPFQIAFPYQGLTQAPQNFGPFGLAVEVPGIFSGLSASTGLPLYSAEKDVNAAGLAPVQGAASATGMDADVNYGIFRAFASLPALADKGLSILQLDPSGNLKVGVVPLGTPLYAQASGAAQVNTATLTIPAAKMGYLDGFDLDGLGATAGSAVALTITGILGGTLTYQIGIPAGVTVPFTLSKKFNPPLQASAVATNIVVSSPSWGAGNTAASVTAYGRYI